MAFDSPLPSLSWWDRFVDGLTRVEPNHRRRVSQVLWFGWWIICSGLGLFMHADPHGHGTHQQLGLPPCPSVMLLGRPCPGCGLTTSWTALLHGDLATAFHVHPLGPVLYLCFTLTAIGGLAAYLKGRSIDTYSPLSSRIMAVVAIIFLGFGFVRFALVSNIATPQESLFPITR